MCWFPAKRGLCHAHTCAHALPHDCPGEPQGAAGLLPRLWTRLPHLLCWLSDGSVPLSLSSLMDIKPSWVSNWKQCHPPHAQVCDCLSLPLCPHPGLCGPLLSSGLGAHCPEPLLGRVKPGTGLLPSSSTWLGQVHKQPLPG